MAFDIDDIPGYGAGEIATQDVGPAARRVRAGKAPEPVAKTDAELGIERGPEFAYEGHGRNRQSSKVNPGADTHPGQVAPEGVYIGPGGQPDQHGFTDNELSQDPLAQAVVAAPLAAGAAELAGLGAAAAGAGKLAARMLGGAAGGATAAGVTGEDPIVGAAVGAGLPAAGAAVTALAKGAAARRAGELFKRVGRSSPAPVQRELEQMGQEKFDTIVDKHGIGAADDPRAASAAALSKTEAELRAAQAAKETAAWDALPQEERLYRQIGQLAGPTGKAKIDLVGKAKVVGALERAGVSSMPDAATAAPVIKAAEANIGKRIGSAYGALDSSGARWTTVRESLDAMDKLRLELEGAVATKPEADAIGRYMKDFVRAYKGNESAPVSAASLNREIGTLQAKGFAATGVELPQGTASKLGRDLSRALDGVLQGHIDRAARFNPAAKATAQELRTLNADYQSIKTVRPFVTGRAAAERFARPAEAETVAPIERVIAKLGPEGAGQASEYKALRAISDSFSKADADRAFAPSLGQRVADTTLGQAAGAVARAPVRAAVGTIRAADVALARLFAAKAAGQVTPELIQAAEAAGVQAPVLQHFLRPAHEAQ